MLILIIIKSILNKKNHNKICIILFGLDFMDFNSLRNRTSMVHNSWFARYTCSPVYLQYIHKLLKPSWIKILKTRDQTRVSF